ncbi:membrane protein [Lentzea sp. NBRC 105346]|uniref:Rv2732c family membrane protein n=1 Tax=Lentzea sp. NBRC 105346 TaxID=3032205 RepID=UPI0024A23DF9|nr:hypothetical protein [Lentzea sp. NBRC 105346]GLZ34216.1 membrane protein [Lentzea sp. NBRC 105346]
MSDPDDLAAYGEEIDEVERDVARRIDPGAGALTIAISVLAILLSLIMPWVGSVRGLSVLLGDPLVGFLPRLFVFVALVVGVLGSGIGLVTRRWGMAWVCALGLFAGSVIGVLSIWSQQTTTSNKTPGPGPGFGLVLAVIAVIVLLVKWLRIAASRPPRL